MRFRTREELTAHAISRCTKAQAEKLQQYLGAKWFVTRVDGLQGYDSVVCIQLDRTPAVIDPTGFVTRAGHGCKTVSYKYPKTNIAAQEKRASV